VKNPFENGFGLIFKNDECFTYLRLRITMGSYFGKTLASNGFFTCFG